MKSEEKIEEEIFSCEVAIKKLGPTDSCGKRHLEKEIETLRWVLSDER